MGQMWPAWGLPARHHPPSSGKMGWTLLGQERSLPLSLGPSTPRWQLDTSPHHFLTLLGVGRSSFLSTGPCVTFLCSEEHLRQLDSPKPKVDGVQMYTADPFVLLALRCFCFLAKSWPCIPFSCVSIFNVFLIFIFDCGCAACGILVC